MSHAPLFARRPGSILVLACVFSCASLPFSVPAAADPTAGFVEEWSGTSTAGWGGGASYVNPGTNGVGGAGDGYLHISTATPGHLGSFTIEPEYFGDWHAAAISEVHLWLNQVDGAQPLEIHFSIGTAGINFWQYNEPFVPLPRGRWIEFVVDLTDASRFTQISGTGTFEAALRNVDRVHVRHDRAPFIMNPDAIQGDVGLDHLELRGETTTVRPTTWGRIKALHR